jgi:hypothetical protein
MLNLFRKAQGFEPRSWSYPSSKLHAYMNLPACTYSLPGAEPRDRLETPCVYNIQACYRKANAPTGEQSSFVSGRVEGRADFIGSREIMTKQHLLQWPSPHNSSTCNHRRIRQRSTDHVDLSSEEMLETEASRMMDRMLSSFR